MASGSLDGTVRRWNVLTGQQLTQLNHGGPVASVAVRDDGQRWASASTNNSVKLWNATNNQQLAEMKGDFERGLSARGKEQRNLLAQLAGLQAGFERELAAANLEKEALRGQITALRGDLDHLRTRDEQLRVELQQRFDQLRIERDAANGRIEALSSSF